jgi:hypothetical protein
LEGESLIWETRERASVSNTPLKQQRTHNIHH